MYLNGLFGPGGIVWRFLMYYASFGMLAIVIHVIINLDALRKPKGTANRTVRERYRQFLYIVMLYYLSDILWGILYSRKLIPLAYADTVLYFAAMVLSVLLWTRFVVSYLGKKSLYNSILIIGGWVIMSYEVIVLIINFFYPIVFSFSKDKEYQPGQARYITLIIQMGLFMMTSVYALLVAVRAEGSESFQHRTIGVSGLVMTIFILLQSVYPLLPFYAIGCLLATCIIHSFVISNERHEQRTEMATARKMAYRDPLTGVKNKLSYLESVSGIDERIQKGEIEEFGVVVFDLNGLKRINDTLGHDAGDVYIQDGCRLICHQFKHSPVFRVGGDEFIAFLEGADYENRETLLHDFNARIIDNLKKGAVVVSSGLGEYMPGRDRDYQEIFKRADRKMYDCKGYLKSLPAGNEA